MTTTEYNQAVDDIATAFAGVARAEALLEAWREATATHTPTEIVQNPDLFAAIELHADQAKARMFAAAYDVLLGELQSRKQRTWEHAAAVMPNLNTEQAVHYQLRRARSLLNET